MAASLAWGGQRNGYINAALLVSIGRGFLLEATAAAQFLAARAFLIAVYGIDPLAYISETYRDIDGQEYQKRRWTLLGKPGNAATPGFSVHGWAKAIDFNVDAMTEDIYNIIMAVLARYGFIRDFLDIGETWHTSFREASITVTASDSTTPFEEDFLSALTDQQQRDLLAFVTEIKENADRTFREVSGYGDTTNQSLKGRVLSLQTDVGEAKSNVDIATREVTAFEDTEGKSLKGRVFGLQEAVAKVAAGGVDLDALASKIAAKLPAGSINAPTLAAAVADELANRLVK